MISDRFSQGMFRVEDTQKHTSPYNRPMMAKTPLPIAAPRMGTAVAGARPPDVLEDAATPVAEAPLVLPGVWCLPVTVTL